MQGAYIHKTVFCTFVKQSFAGSQIYKGTLSTITPLATMQISILRTTLNTLLLASYCPKEQAQTQEWS